MSYVVFNVDKDKAHPNSYSPKIYESLGSAKGIATKLTNKTNEVHTAMPYGIFQALPIKMITKVNLMSGQEFQIAEDTPRCCDPSTELYWTM